MNGTNDLPQPEIEPFVFVLLREGASDDGLVPHLSSLLIEAGAQVVIGSARPYRGTVEEKVSALLAEGAHVDCVFVHRDADRAGAEERYAEIRSGVEAAGEVSHVGVVPIQELEAWLMVDEAAIRNVVGRPKGEDPLGLPPLRTVESLANPKERLQQALLAAAEDTGRRRDRTKRQFSLHRSLLLQRLRIDGPVRELSAWKQLESDVADLVADS